MTLWWAYHYYTYFQIKHIMNILLTWYLCTINYCVNPLQWVSIQIRCQILPEFSIITETLTYAIKDFVIHLQHKLLLEVKDKIITSLEWIDILNKILDALSLLNIKNNCRLSIDPLSNENKNQLEGTCWF